MKALQLVGPRNFRQVELPSPEADRLAPGKLLIRPLTLSLCGSDIPFFTGGKRHRSYPMPPGAPIHECLGEVISSATAEFEPGQRVIAIPEGDQGLAEVFLASASKAVPLDDPLAEDRNCVLIQPLSTVLNALDRLGDVSGKKVLVIGLGSIGLFFCWLLQKRGAAAVTGIDPLAGRCSLAERMGASRTLATRSIEAVHAARLENWEAADVCIEAVGHQMETLNDCFELVRAQGTVLAFGVPDQPVYAIEYETFFRKNLQLTAVVTPVWREYLARARDLYQTCQAELAPLITHHLPISAAGEAFSLYEQHADGVVKILLDAQDW